jgi:DNA-binding Lrp family transcriptional regulator
MVTALVMMNVERGKVSEVAERLLKLDGVTEVFSVAGQYDCVAILRTPTNEEIAELVTAKLLNIPHIKRTETLMAFKVFSREDLGAMFSIGNEEASR